MLALIDHTHTGLPRTTPTLSARPAAGLRPLARWAGVVAVCVTWLVLAVPALAQDADDRIRDLLRNSDLGPTKVSVAVMDVDSGRWLVEREADEPRVPASNMKLITTAAAVELLGPRFTFTTELQMVPAADFHGSDYDPAKGHGPALVVIGSGDPGLGDPKLLREHLGIDAEALLEIWVDKIVETGQKRFDAIVIDDRVFDQQFIHPGWPQDQLINWYCAPVAGINFHDNCLDILPKPAATRGLAPEVSIYPAAPFLDTTNTATTGSEDTFWVSRRTGTNHLRFHGQVRTHRRSPISVTVNDPPDLFARLLIHRLARRGVTVATVQRMDEGAAQLRGQSLHTIRTTLPPILERTNRDSMNLFAEALFKRLGHQVTGSPGSFDNGAAAVRIYLHNVLGPRSAVATVVDGSGLSKDNRVTARLLVQVLQRMHHSPYVDTYRSSLAHAGKTAEGTAASSGTLHNRFNKLGNEAWVFGKTGYINQVSALSGYLVFPDPDDADRHKVYAFAILCNGFRPPASNRSMKDLQDQIVTIIEQAERRPSVVAQ